MATLRFHPEHTAYPLVARLLAVIGRDGATRAADMRTPVAGRCPIETTPT
ncbi:hypothetical protein [Nocardia carnea]|uniref:Uncharacterized protein n=1 Tax=Nocardia flavorosea TaxID=53429 RepID=A0A846YB91_9NOCA|nr:hypothetical protein [Nocardia carnea]NKY55041.1 hypothetical protein [Nocardia flavorosea]